MRNKYTITGFYITNGKFSWFKKYYSTTYYESVKDCIKWCATWFECELLDDIVLISIQEGYDNT